MTKVGAAIAEGMAGAEAMTSDGRKAEMLKAIRRVARERVFFTADDVWVVLGGVGDDGGDDGSGLGPVMNNARRLGFIENTGSFRRSERPATHGKPLPIWTAGLGSL